LCARGVHQFLATAFSTFKQKITSLCSPWNWS
jgi:hypothetical protein